jgi:pyruvate kinase
MEGKPVITATQLLHSMIESPRPTRAEVSDVANAIYDLTSAVMLSGESSIGKYPIKCVETLSNIANRIESAINYKDVYIQSISRFDSSQDMTRAVTNAALTTAYEIGAKAIVTFTETGYTAQMLSKMRPDMPIIAITTSKKVRRQLSMNWGVFPMVGNEYHTLDEMQKDAISLSLESGLVGNGDIIVIVAGVPVGIAGATNLIKVEIVGDVLIKGIGVHPGKVTGRVCLGEIPEELKLNFNKGDVVVVKYLHESLLPFLKQASAIIIEDDDIEDRAQIIGKTLDIPIIKSAKSAYDILKEGIMVKVNSKEGTVSKI